MEDREYNAEDHVEGEEAEGENQYSGENQNSNEDEDEGDRGRDQGENPTDSRPDGFFDRPNEFGIIVPDNNAY